MTRSKPRAAPGTCRRSGGANDCTFSCGCMAATPLRQIEGPAAALHSPNFDVGVLCHFNAWIDATIPSLDHSTCIMHAGGAVCGSSSATPDESGRAGQPHAFHHAYTLSPGLTATSFFFPNVAFKLLNSPNQHFLFLVTRNTRFFQRVPMLGVHCESACLLGP
jgi:hypothetical protein